LYVLLITLGFLVYQSCLSLFFTELLFLQISFGFLACLFLDAFLQSFAYIKKKKADRFHFNTLDRDVNLRIYQIRIQYKTNENNIEN
jgi:hypothetical protein